MAVDHCRSPPMPVVFEDLVNKTSSKGSARSVKDRDSSHRSKHGSGRHRRLLAEIFELYPHLKSRPSISERDDETKTSHSFAHDPSPTDSHAHRRTHSRHSSGSISGILIMTTERLHSETARANAAEKQIADVMSLFKNTYEQKVKLERELARAKEDLGWYKVQLDVAQKEIFRAQETVERIDRRRVEAEESAVRAREKARKLGEARAVDRAMEEGRLLGYEEGLRQGRMLAQNDPPKQSRTKKESDSASSESSKSHRSRSKSIRRPLEAPSRPRSTSSRPEEITIQNSNAPDRHVSTQRQSPTPSRRSVAVPDNYIPVLNPDATITLPAPHELATPIPTEPQTPRPLSAGLVSRPQDSDRVETYTEKIRGRINSAAASVGYATTPPSPTPRREPPDPDRIVTIVAPEATEPRSPSVYPNRPPRRTREIVLPVPLGNQLLGNNITAAVPSRPGTAKTPSPPKSRHPIRTASNMTIPGIEVETPSTKSAKSETAQYNPALLSPEQANSRSTPLPSQLQPNESPQSKSPAVLGLFDPSGKDAISGTLLDNNLPSGFVPLSPIPGMASLNPYPPGFTPPGQTNQPTANRPPPDFTYPASPLAR